MKTFLWIIFISVTIVMACQDRVLRCGTTGHYGVIDVEKAGPVQGLVILNEWNGKRYADKTLVQVAVNNTRWDFLFIFCYVALLLLHSNDQMQREKWLWLNGLLRLNILLALLAGTFDIIEDLLLFYDFRHVPDNLYLQTIWFTVPKFVLAFWALAVFLFSAIKTAIANSIKEKSRQGPA